MPAGSKEKEKQKIYAASRYHFMQLLFCLDTLNGYQPKIPEKSRY